MTQAKQVGRIRSILQLYDAIPDNERIIVDVLRQLLRDNLPGYCKEKISYNVPFFYGNRGICIIWPASIPRGGIKTGVLLGFWHGNKLKDKENYLTHGTNRQVYYRVFTHADDIDPAPILTLLKEALELDHSTH